jgi:hypothetical protein
MNHSLEEEEVELDLGAGADSFERVTGTETLIKR